VVQGPALIEELSATCYLPPAARAEVLADHTLAIDP
jgi:hypothetical protein